MPSLRISISACLWHLLYHAPRPSLIFHLLHWRPPCFLGWPLFLFPGGVYLKAILHISNVSFLRIWPIHFHRFFLLSGQICQLFELFWIALCCWSCLARISWGSFGGILFGSCLVFVWSFVVNVYWNAPETEQECFYSLPLWLLVSQM